MHILLFVKSKMCIDLMWPLTANKSYCRGLLLTQASTITFICSSHTKSMHILLLTQASTITFICSSHTKVKCA
jgi:hypothetical protein